MLNLACSVSVSSLSEKSFNTTIVLLKANHIAKYNEVMVSNHIHRDIVHHIIAVITTWATPIHNELFPISFIILGFSSNPTINSSKLIPILEKVSNEILSCNNQGNNKLISIQAIMYPIINGCLKNFIIPKAMITIPIIILNPVNICSVMYWLSTK